ncbi:MAG: SGNH/GDSL hydrolase family protein [Clostridium sp.]
MDKKWPMELLESREDMIKSKVNYKEKLVIKSRIFRIVISCIIMIASIWDLGRVFTPKYTTGILEGSLIDDYYYTKKDNDVIFIGDCEIYQNYSPIALWQEYGVKSFIRASPQQLIWQSYYILEDTLKYEKPKVIVLNVSSMQHNEPVNEAYNRMTLDGMKMSKTKIEAIKASMLKEETIISYIFPIFRYHSRWSELKKDDFKYAFKNVDNSHNGYLMRIDEKPTTTKRRGRELANYEFGENTYYYLDKITRLCKENNISLVLVKAPSVWPPWYDEWNAQILNYEKENDLIYINFLEYIEEIGLDYTTDTFDAGLHLNLKGGEKLCKYFGQILIKNFDLEDSRNDIETVKIYEKNIDKYELMKRLQQKELEEHGYLKSYGGVDIKDEGSR